MAVARSEAVRRAAERGATEIRDATGASAAVPVDVAAVASALDVRVVIASRDAFDARLGRRDGIWHVEVARTSAERGRYSLAHELGHVFLREREPDLLRSLDHRSEERFCDAFAAALLLPVGWLESHRGRSESLETLRRLAGSADVSLSACLIGLRTHGRWRGSLLRFRRTESVWSLAAASGLPYGLQGRVGVERASELALQLAADQPNGLADGRMVLSVAGYSATVTADIMVTGAGAVSLVDLSTVSHLGRPLWASRSDVPAAYTDWFQPR